jgi:excisionase family DNA binding protein
MPEIKKEFMTLDEAAAYIGMKRATIYNYMKDLKIETHKFGRDRRAYIAMSDVERMKEYKEKPWLIGAKPNQDGKEAA